MDINYPRKFYPPTFVLDYNSILELPYNSMKILTLEIFRRYGTCYIFCVHIYVRFFHARSHIYCVQIEIIVCIAPT